MAAVDPTKDPVLGEIVRRLIQEFQPDAIHLFGSVARGEAGPDSDYDVMVIVRSSPEPRYRRAQRAQRALWGMKKGADVLVMTRAEFDEAQAVFCSLPATISREGKKLYAA